MFDLVALPIDLAASDYINTLWQFCLLVQSVVVSVVTSNCFLHVDTGACLHNVRLTSTENGAVFCSTVGKTVALLHRV